MNTNSLSNSNVIVVQSVSDFDSSLSGVAYLIRDEISGNVTLGPDCILVFQGGMLTGGTVAGNHTRIEAPLVEIFGRTAQITGTWHVPVAHPEWFEPDIFDLSDYVLPDSQGRTRWSSVTVADDASRFNKAFKLLMPGDSADENTAGGKVLVTGTYRIFSMITVPRHIYIEGAAPALTRIFLPTPSEVSPVTCQPANPNADIVLDIDALASQQFERVVTRIDHNNVSHSVTVQAALYFQNAQFDDRQNNKGCGARDLRILMNEVPCHGIYVEKAYDQSIWENVEVEEVNLNFNAFRFTISDEATGIVAQTVMLKNCIGYRRSNYPQPAENEPANLTPVFYFHHYQECNIIGCKAFISLTNTGQKYGGTGFHLEGCRGIVMEGCSCGFGLNGIEISAVTRFSSGITISGLTTEVLYGHDVWANGTNVNICVSGLTLLPIRHQSSPSDIMLNNCFNSFVISPSGQQVTLTGGSTRNFVISSSPLRNIDGNGDVFIGTQRGNTNILIPNYEIGTIGLMVQDRLRVREGDFAANSGFDILRTESSITPGTTGLTLGVHNGSKKSLRVELGQVNADGSRALVIKDNSPISTSGPVASKPTSGVQAGFFYYATDLHKPIWYTGSVWVDADGTVV